MSFAEFYQKRQIRAIFLLQNTLDVDLDSNAGFQQNYGKYYRDYSMTRASFVTIRYSLSLCLNNRAILLPP